MQPKEKQIPNKEDTISIIKKECRNKGVFLDVGCGSGKMLLFAEDAGFERMVGFDKRSSPKIQLIEWKAERAGVPYKDFCLTPGAELSNYSLPYPCNHKEFPFEAFNYDCILFNNFLHFICDEEKYTLIDRCYKLLNPGGIIFIRIHHNRNPDFTDSSKMDKVSETVWKEKPPFDNRFIFMVKEEDFKLNLVKYPQLAEHYLIDDYGIRLVIKKPG